MPHNPRPSPPDHYGGEPRRKWASYALPYAPIASAIPLVFFLTAGGASLAKTARLAGSLPYKIWSEAAADETAFSLRMWAGSLSQ